MNKNQWIKIAVVLFVILNVILIAVPKLKKELVGQIDINVDPNAQVECVNDSGADSELRIYSAKKKKPKKIKLKNNGAETIYLSEYAGTPNLRVDIIQRRGTVPTKCYFVTFKEEEESKILNPDPELSPEEIQKRAINVSLPINTFQGLSNVIVLTKASEELTVAKIEIYSNKGKNRSTDNLSNVQVGEELKEVDLTKEVGSDFEGAVKIKAISGALMVEERRSRANNESKNSGAQTRSADLVVQENNPKTVIKSPLIVKAEGATITPTALSSRKPKSDKKCNTFSFVCSTNGTGSACSEDYECGHWACNGNTKLCERAAGKGAANDDAEKGCYTNFACKHFECDNNGFCDKIEKNTTGNTTDKCISNSSSDPVCGHYICGTTSNNLCNRWDPDSDGHTEDECESCPSHLECVVGRCEIKSGSGANKDGCSQRDGRCSTTTTTTTTTTLPLKTCDENTETCRVGGGTKKCENSSECHYKNSCDSNNTCLKISGEGPDSCEISKTCNNNRPKHLKCLVNKCQLVNGQSPIGEAEDGCLNVNAECTPEPIPPGSSCDAKIPRCVIGGPGLPCISSHDECKLGCNLFGQCIPGGGNGDCAKDGDCRFVTPPTNLPPLSPPVSCQAQLSGAECGVCLESVLATVNPGQLYEKKCDSTPADPKSCSFNPPLCDFQQGIGSNCCNIGLDRKCAGKCVGRGQCKNPPTPPSGKCLYCHNEGVLFLVTSCLPGTICESPDPNCVSSGVNGKICNANCVNNTPPLTPLTGCENFAANLPEPAIDKCFYCFGNDSIWYIGKQNCSGNKFCKHPASHDGRVPPYYTTSCVDMPITTTPSGIENKKCDKVTPFQCVVNGAGKPCTNNPECFLACDTDGFCRPGATGHACTGNNTDECLDEPIPVASVTPTITPIGTPSATASATLALPMPTPIVSAKDSTSNHARARLSEEPVETNSLLILPSKGSTIGKDSAPVKIKMFQDIKCGMCKYAFKNILPEIARDYIETGKVQFIFKEYPLIPRELEMKLAEAVECAGDQGKYTLYLGSIYEKGKDTTIEKLSDYAKEVGLDEKKFNQCMSSKKHAKTVKQHMEEGKKLGINGTPTFYVNNTQVLGAQPYEKFKEAIEAELKNQ